MDYNNFNIMNDFDTCIKSLKMYASICVSKTDEKKHVTKDGKLT